MSVIITKSSKFRKTLLMNASVLAVVSLLSLSTAQADVSKLFINEIHYDNSGADVDEFVEIAGPAGTDLTGVTVQLYNGTASQRSVYRTISFEGTIDDEGSGFGAVSVAQAGIQNGAPDGMALVGPGGELIQFLSYEGSFVAASGPAAGLTSTDIGVAQISSTPVSDTLQLIGTGSVYSDFTWTGPVAPRSPGSINDGQAFIPDDNNAPRFFINEIHYDNSGSDVEEGIEIAGPAGTSLSGASLVLYNGNGGLVYNTVSLSGVLSDQLDNYGVLFFNVPGLQNGSPDGIALVDANGNVIEFISYEGSLLAQDGPAVGLSSVDIGVSQSSTTPIGETLQLTGNLGSFVWSGPVSETRGQPNVGQAFGDGDPDGPGGDPDFYPIADIQGTGDSSPLVGQVVLTSGIVVGDFQGVVDSTQFHPQQLNGFFIQSADAQADADPASSEGLFVFCDACAQDVSVGDAVSIIGSVSERFGMTSIESTEVALDSQDNPLPTPALIDLPIASSDEFEAFEGMLVQFVDKLTIAEYFALSRFGEVILYEGGRPYQFTHENTPSVDGLAAYEQSLAARRIILDDDANGQNQALFEGLNIFYPQPGLSTGNFFRGGDTITGLTGVLDFAFSNWRVRPVVEAFNYQFEPENLRPEGPEDVGGSLKVVSTNVLNYFTTIDETSNSSGPCGPNGTADCRGADSVAELNRQLNKLSTALCEMNGDIVGLIEIENDLTNASMTSLIEGVQSRCGLQYNFIDTGPIGTDAIKVGLIYKDTVTPLGDHYIVDNSVNPDYQDNRNRPTLIQEFMEVGSEQSLIVAVHHLKSKGSSCNDTEDFDLNDGQANCNLTRTNAAQIVIDYINNTVIPAANTNRVLAIGDMNAYKLEDPIRAFKDAGYVDLIEQFKGNDAYSFVFDGQLGYLDHALGLNLSEATTGVSEWHVNADEIPLFDYNDDVLDAGERSFEQEPGALPLFEANSATRFSDHDPVIVGLDLGANNGPIRGDLNNDGVIDFADASVLFGALFSREGDGNYLADADLDSNGVIDFSDYRIWFQLYLDAQS